MKLLVLAAGIGSRFGGIKQIAGVGPANETLLEYSLFDARRAGFDHVVFLIRPEIEGDFKKQIIARLPSSLLYSFAYQTPLSLLDGAARAVYEKSGRKKPWGTGHALLCAREEIGSDTPFMVINADDFYGALSFAKIGAHLLSNPGEFCFPGYRLDDVVPKSGSVSRAVCAVSAGGYLEEIVEHKRVERSAGDFLSRQEGAGAAITLSPDAVVSMNIWGFNPSIFDYADQLWKKFLSEPSNFESVEFFLPDIVQSIVKKKIIRVRVLHASSRSFGLTNPGDLQETRRRVAELVADGAYPSPLWRGNYGQ